MNEFGNMKTQLNKYINTFFVGTNVPEHVEFMVKQAWFAGAFATYATFMKASDLPEDEAMLALEQVGKELGDLQTSLMEGKEDIPKKRINL